MTFEELMMEHQKAEEERKQRVFEQILNGCDKCSQWDDYWGCSKCENTLF